MRNFLDEIIALKKQEVEQLKETSNFPVHFGANDNLKEDKKNSFTEKIKNSEEIVIISEIKRASPSKGPLNMGINPADMAKNYEEAGATAISVLTEKNYFKGSIEDFIEVRNVVKVPLLRKDFIIDEIQIDEAKFHGADLILLIVAALDDKRLKELYNHAKALNLEVLVETHNEEEIVRALELKPMLIGINNRNLKTFEVTLDTTFNLVDLAKRDGAFVISESGISTKEQVEALSKAGVSGILVGESFVTSEGFKEKLKSFKVKKAII